MLLSIGDGIAHVHGLRNVRTEEMVVFFRFKGYVSELGT